MDMYDKLLAEYSKHNPCNKYRILLFLNYVKTHGIPVRYWDKTYKDHEDEFMKGLSERSWKDYKPQMKKFIKYAEDRYDNGRIIPKRKHTRIVDHWSKL